MFNAFRAQRPSLFSYSLPNTPKPSAGVRFAQSVSGSKQPDSSEEMDPKQGHESKTRDTNTMSSFGEGYSTRSDEEGFGGTHQSLRKDDDDDHHGKDDRPAAEFDHSQGSEVKEEEKSRNQSKVSS